MVRFIRQRLNVMALVMAVSVPVSFVACAGGNAMVSTSPNADQQAVIRERAARVADGLKVGAVILMSAGWLIDASNMTVAEKDEYDKAIIAVVGTTQRPGPLPAAVTALGTVTSEASLSTTTSAVLTVLDPVVKKMESSSNLGVAGFGASLRAATAFARLVAGR